MITVTTMNGRIYTDEILRLTEKFVRINRKEGYVYIPLTNVDTIEIKPEKEENNYESTSECIQPQHA